MKIIKKIIIVLALIIVASELLMVVTGKTFLNKVFANTIFVGKLSPDIDELDQFEKREVKNNKPEPWFVSEQYNKTELPDTTIKRIEGLQTVAFLVIKNDSLLYEKYWEKYNKESFSNSFSMAKSITEILIGVALDIICLFFIPNHAKF